MSVVGFDCEGHPRTHRKMRANCGGDGLSRQASGNPTSTSKDEANFLIY